MRCPDGFNPDMWENLTTKQQRHIVDAVGDVETLLQGDEQEMTTLHATVYSQCWLAMKKTIFRDGVLSATVTLDQMDALEQYALTQLVQTMRAIVTRHKTERN